MVKLWLHPKQETRELACQNKIYEKLNPGSSLRLQAQAPDSGSGLQAGSANSLFGLVVKPRKLINRRRLASESERQSRGRFECFHGRLLLTPHKGWALQLKTNSPPSPPFRHLSMFIAVVTAMVMYRNLTDLFSTDPTGGMGDNYEV